MMNKSLIRRLVGVGVVTAAASTAGVASIAAQASPAPSHQPKVIASGLNSPRQLAFSPSGSLYVAEAGTTGTTACRPSPLDPTGVAQACVGLTGSVARIGAKGHVHRVVTGLPSVGSPADALGPADLVFTGNHTFALTTGLGGSPEFRTSFGPKGNNLGKLLNVELRSHGKARVTTIADLARFEAKKNPDGTDVDSDPTGLARSGKGFVFTDSGGNSINAVRRSHVSNVAVLAPVLTTQPSPAGPPAGFPADSVPTDVVKGPDGAWYVAQLVGFPFEKGSAAIWRVKPGHAPTKWATGLTNVTSLAFDKKGHLYAVEIASNGLLTGPPGALVRVRPHSSSPTVVAGGLVMPYGLALRGDYAYVTTHSTEAGAGQVVRVHL